MGGRSSWGFHSAVTKAGVGARAHSGVAPSPLHPELGVADLFPIPPPFPSIRHHSLAHVLGGIIVIKALLNASTLQAEIYRRWSKPCSHSLLWLRGERPRLCPATGREGRGAGGTQGPPPHPVRLFPAVPAEVPRFPLPR